MPNINGFPVFPRAGILTRAEDPDFAKPIQAAFSTGEEITVLYTEGGTDIFPSSDITLDPNTGRLSFVALGETYTVREPREDDGSWVSRYRLFLPLDAVETLIEAGDGTVALADSVNSGGETLDAFAGEDSAFVLGLVYTNNGGRWLRTEGDWLQLSPNDETFNDMIVMSIDPERAQEFVDLYDRNYVSVTDAEEYELDGAQLDEE